MSDKTALKDECQGDALSVGIIVFIRKIYNK